MAESDKAFLVDGSGNIVAEVRLTNYEEGWFTGFVISEKFPLEIKKALEWYDEVVRDQMLSYLDEATASVEQFALAATFHDGSNCKVYSLHVEPVLYSNYAEYTHSVTFRTTPISPAAGLPTTTGPALPPQSTDRPNRRSNPSDGIAQTLSDATGS